MPAAKHVPMRRCAACGDSAAKRGLMRIVRTPDGQVILDPRGKTSGRGTYLCFKPECWELAIKKDRLDHALKVTLTPEQRQALLDDFRTRAQASPS